MAETDPNLGLKAPFHYYFIKLAIVPGLGNLLVTNDTLAAKSDPENTSSFSRQLVNQCRRSIPVC
jgi:hypothetical protein